AGRRAPGGGAPTAALPVTADAEPLGIRDRLAMLDATARLDSVGRRDVEQGRTCGSAVLPKTMSGLPAEPGSVASVLVIDRARQLPRDPSHAWGVAWA
ncbi:hypothetical protein, partial [Nocardia sp. NPDC056564]|uniref:hypothetical protein n=1 Tax=Nocardia sp. NPDC056564 TaxID=3345865 RepID=UPI00366AD28C